MRLSYANKQINLTAVLFYITQKENSKDLVYMSLFTLFSFIFTDQTQETQFHQE